jgi:hypothetical protein
MISMKKGTASLSLISLRIWNTGLEVTTEAPIELQHALAKLHLKKRCATVSDFLLMQRSQVYESSSTSCLWSRSRVLSLSLSRSQKNTLCFIWHFENLFLMQRSQVYESSSTSCLWSRSRVLSLPLSRSQKNTLCFIWHFENLFLF